MQINSSRKYRFCAVIQPDCVFRPTSKEIAYLGKLCSDVCVELRDDVFKKGIIKQT